MNIKNEDHAVKMLKEWQTLTETARKRQIKTAIENLELSSMYYEQKGNVKGAARAERCIVLLKDHTWGPT